MSTLIVNPMPTATADGIKSALLAQITSAQPFAVNLTEREKEGKRNMAEGREGYARMVSQIANVHINSLARELNANDLTAKLAYDAKLEEIRQVLLKLMEIIEETQYANGIDIMKLVDVFVENLQTSRKNNGALDLALREVDEWNKRFGARPNVGNDSSTGTPTPEVS